MGDLQVQLPTQSLSVQQFLTPKPHPPYSPNLTPSNFFLLPQMKKVLKDKRFASVQEVKQKIAEALKGIKIRELENYLKQREKCLNRFIVSNGEYFEGD